ncbi:MAG: endonuclease III [Firmicutes bacterium]|nr:endonuclease III [Bacillota bacterium]
MSRKAKAKAILDILQQKIPSPATELNFSTPWQLLVATILSAQSTDKQVNKVTEKLFSAFPGPQELLTLTEEELAAKIKTLGLFRSKSKHILATARDIVTKYKGEVPQTFAELVNLPGVGRKTANVVLANAFDIPALAVDTHVFRVAKRTGLSKGNTVLETEEQLKEAIPRQRWKDAHHLLILHGRYTCKARNPQCLQCPVSAHCDEVKKNPQPSS